MGRGLPQQRPLFGHFHGTTTPICQIFTDSPVNIIEYFEYLKSISGKFCMMARFRFNEYETADPHSSIATFKRNWFRKKQNRMPLTRKQSKLFAQKEVVQITPILDKSHESHQSLSKITPFLDKTANFFGHSVQIIHYFGQVLGFLRGFVQITVKSRLLCKIPIQCIQPR